MPLLTAYAFRDTFFHRLDPRTKLVWLVAMLVLCFATSRILLLLGLVVFVLGLSWTARLDLRSFLPVTRMVSFFSIGVILVQTIFHAEGEILFRLGPVDFYAGGLWLAVQVILRLYCIILLFLQFLMWTHPTDVSLVLVKAKVPYKYAMLLGLTLRFFPVFEQELAAIYEAQEARGLDLRGSVRRARAFVPIVVPFCLRTLRRANEVALAMELRGYGYRPERTFLRTIEYRRVDQAVTAAILICLAAYFAAWMYRF
ncbi:MAG: energy-coupling factor transporter transmembrane protein EcfT [Chloroflexi bacterium]|nr:energy-coupling factor transporter transmembrane protein EcfT [Chloroflexota bacterium]